MPFYLEMSKNVTKQRDVSLFSYIYIYIYIYILYIYIYILAEILFFENLSRKKEHVIYILFCCWNVAHDAQGTLVKSCCSTEIPAP